MSGWARVANGAILALSMPAWLRFHQAVRDPVRAQAAILRRLLAQNARTEFGIIHGFQDVAGIDDWRRRVPLRDYDEYSPWIRRIESGVPNVLTADPVRFLEPTGGSSGASKKIPYTAGLMAEFSAATLPWSADLLLHRPRLRHGRAYWAMSPPTSAGGMGHERDTFPPAVRWLLGHTVAAPARAALAQDPERWQEITLRTLLEARDLAFISVWSPSFLSLLVEGIQADDAGTCWPQLDLISCWTDASAARPLERVRRRFPHVDVQGKGLLATEGIISIPWLGIPAPVAAVTSHFLEFLDADGPHLLHEVDEGRTYEVVLSTGGGLYRYRLKDLVRVEGFLHGTPLLRFVGRADGVIDLAGEKLAPGFVEQAMARAMQAVRVSPSFAMLAPSGSEPARYVLYTDVPRGGFELATQLDLDLRRSHHYNLCRTLGQLAPVRAVIHPGAERIYHEVCSAHGQRVAVIKPRSLAPDLGWEAAFATTLEAVS